MTTTIIKILFFLVFSNTVFGQDLNSIPSHLLYGHERLPLRDIFFLRNNFKMVSTIQESNKPLKYYLLNEENIIYDTIDNRYYIFDLHHTEQEKIIVLNRKSVSLFKMNAQKLIFYWSDTLYNDLEYPVFFNQNIMAIRNNKKDIHLYEIDTSARKQNRVATFSKIKHKSRKQLHQLPVAFGMTSDELFIFLRDAQVLIMMKENGEFNVFHFPLNEEYHWAFFFDPWTERKYGIQINNDGYYLYQLIDDKMKPLKAINHFPKRIYKDNVIFCKSGLNEWCDFIAEPIFKN